MVGIGLQHMMRICLITSNLRNHLDEREVGGVCYHLAALLSHHGLEVLVLTTDASDSLSWHTLTECFRKLNVRLVAVGPKSQRRPPYYGYITEPIRTSLCVQEYLLKHSFDVIHFVDDGGAGFIPIQSKRVGIAHGHSVITQMLNVPIEWLYQVKKAFPSEPQGYFTVRYTERYAFAQADYGIVPSQRVTEWLKSNHWVFPGHTVRLTPPFWGPFCANSRDRREVLPDRRHLVLVMELGVGNDDSSMLEGLGRALAKTSNSFTKISVCEVQRRHCRVLSQNGVELKQLAKEFPTIAFKRRRVKTYGEALDYLEDTRGIGVFAFCTHDIVNTLMQAMLRGLPFIAPAVGSVGGVVCDDRALYQPGIRGLADAINRIEGVDFSWVNRSFSYEASNNAWLAFHDRLKQHLPRSVLKSEPQGRSNPLVSVCIPHFNMAENLEKCLQSLLDNTYPHFEIVCIDDGSTSLQDRERFRLLEKKYIQLGWRFILLERGGVCRARNQAATLARGELLIFVDSDNVAKQEMIQTMVRAIQVSQADCLTCHFDGFYEDED